MKFCPKCGDILRDGPCSKCDLESVEASPDSGGFDAASDKTYGHISTGFKSRTADEGVRELLGVMDGMGISRTTYTTYPKCTGCGRPIQSGGIKVDGKNYHKECHDNKVTCNVCNKPIFGQVVTAMGKDFCQNCWKCTECHRDLGEDSFVGLNGHPFCTMCADEKKERTRRVKEDRRDAQNAAIEKRNAEARERREIQEDGWRNFKKEQVCSKCGKQMIDTGVVCDDLVFHSECFVCNLCGKDFPDMKYHLRDDLPWHAACVKKAFASKCSVCREPIVGGRIFEFGGEKMHEDCFKCGMCSRPLHGAYVEMNGQNVCEDCAAANARQTRTRAGAPTPQGQTRGGVRVDPVTGRVTRL